MTKNSFYTISLMFWMLAIKGIEYEIKIAIPITLICVINGLFFLIYGSIEEERGDSR